MGLPSLVLGFALVVIGVFKGGDTGNAAFIFAAVFIGIGIFKE